MRIAYVNSKWTVDGRAMPLEQNKLIVNVGPK